MNFPLRSGCPRIIVCFYASLVRGSEYRSGIEFIDYAAAHGFDFAIVSDIPDNIEEGPYRNIEIVRVAQGALNQAELYANDDYQYAKSWLDSVYKLISNRYNFADVVWICNPAQPWLPIHQYFGITRYLIWGPVGGGESLLFKRLALSPNVCLQESARDLLQLFKLLFLRACYWLNHQTKLVILSRTHSAYNQLSMHGFKSIVIPEIINPITPRLISKRPCKKPIFLWIGRDSARKNLDGAIRCFEKYLSMYFSGSELHVYGVEESSRKNFSNNKSIKFFGWVKSIPYSDYLRSGILLSSSHREGLPSAVLESIMSGIFVISTQVGSLSCLIDQPNFIIVSPSFFSSHGKRLADEDRKVLKLIAQHLSRDSLEIKNIDFRQSLNRFLSKIMDSYTI